MKKSNFWIYALSASIYFGQGIENLPFLPFFFYMKETLGLDESRIMFLSAWITVAWLIKPLIGYVIDSSKFSKKVWIIGSLLGSLVFATLLGLITYLPLVWLIIFMAIASTNTAIRDVGVDGVMCVEGKKANITGKIQCFDEETEILTNNGWRNHKTISLNDKALSLNPNSKIADYYPITNIFKYNYAGIVYNIKNSAIDFIFSINHNIFYIKEWKNKYILEPIEFLIKRNLVRHTAFSTTFKWIGKETEIFLLNNTTNKIHKSIINNYKFKMDDWCQFLGWFLSEGCFFEKRIDNQISISQTKRQNLEEIESLLNRLGLKYWKSKTEFFICSKIIKEHIKTFCYIINDQSQKRGTSVYVCYNKCVPNYIKNLSPRQITIFLDAFNKGDGWRRKGEFGFCTTSYFLFNDLQELILKSGNGISYQIRKRTDGQTLYIIHSLFSKSASFDCSKDITKKYYKGILWDIETNPHHLVFIRRNGRAIWTGNSVQWGFITVASVMTGFVGGYLAEHYNYQVGYLILIPIYLIIIAIVTQYKPSKIITKNDNNLLQTLKELFTDKRLLLVCLFLFLYKFSPAFGTPLTFILKDKFMWSKQFIGTMDTLSAGVGLLGAWAYFHYSKKLNLRKWLIASVFISAIITLAYLYFTPITAVIYTVLFSCIGMGISLLILDFMAQNTKKGLESTSFALLCSISNLASTCNSFTGSFLFPIIGLQWLIVISAVASFACLPIIPYLKGAKNV